MLTFKQKIDTINNSPYKVYIICTGGGQSFFADFMQFGGASKTIIGGEIPYSKEATDALIGPQDKYCSTLVARKFATNAYMKGGTSKNVLGIGVTCSLATDGERVGRTHTVYIAIHTFEFTTVYKWEYAPGTHRADEEKDVCDALIDIIYGYAINEEADFSYEYKHKLITNTAYRNSVSNITDVPDADTIYLYPGSWNPYHAGHLQITEAVEEIADCVVVHEIARINADKGILDYIEIKNRLLSIPGHITTNTIMTDEPTFLGKAVEASKHYKNIVFIVGADTWNRIQDSKYAGDVYHLYEHFVEMNVRFMVFPRDTVTGANTILDKLVIHFDKTRLITSPLSSSAIRAQKLADTATVSN